MRSKIPSKAVMKCCPSSQSHGVMRWGPRSPWKAVMMSCPKSPWIAIMRWGPTSPSYVVMRWGPRSTSKAVKVSTHFSENNNIERLYPSLHLWVMLKHICLGDKSNDTSFQATTLHLQMRITNSFFFNKPVETRLPTLTIFCVLSRTVSSNIFAQV